MPLSPAVRRRRAALAVAAAIAATAGAAVGAAGDQDGRRDTAAGRAEPPSNRPAGGPATTRASGGEPGGPATAAGAGGREAGGPVTEAGATGPEERAALALQRDVGALVILRYNGPSVPGYVSRALRQGRAGGVILFRDNLVDPAQLRRITGQIARVSGGRALVMTDQEGGGVRVVPWIGPRRSPARQLAAGAVGASSRTAGRALERAGIDITLAPVADVPSVAGAALAGRAFSSDPARASSAVRTAVKAFRAGGVAPTVKHFPGLGGARRNTDDASVTIPGRPELRPFRSAIAAGAPLVMLSHARYPALDPDRIASQSRRVVEGLLRRDLGFDGVVITDSLEAAAALKEAPVNIGAERSLRAGADLLLTTGPGSAIHVYRRVLAVARRSPAFAGRVHRAAERVRALRRSLR